MTRTRDIPTDTIVEMLVDRFEDLVAVLYPGGVWTRDVVYPEPKSKYDLGSFQIYLANKGKNERGHWRRYSLRIGGGPLQLINYWLTSGTRHLEPYGEAVAWAKRWLRIDREMTPAERKSFDEQRAREKVKADKIKAQAAAAAEADLERARAHAREILLGAHGVEEGDAVWTYLTGSKPWGRNFPLVTVPGAIRIHDDLKYFGGKGERDHRGPAMVLTLTDGVRRMPGVHCTWLKPAGRGKAFAGGASKIMRGDILGGFVPIGLGSGPAHVLAAEGRSEPLVIAEGSETGVGFWVANPEVRVWSCLSLGNIAHAPVHHPAISQIFVLAENDTKPQAQEQLEDVLETLSRSGKPVTPLRSHVGSDFADQF